MVLPENTEWANEYWDRIKSTPKFSSGLEAMDKILMGGITPYMSYLLTGDPKHIHSSLQILCVNYLISHNQMVDSQKKIAFIDGVNRFNPYEISKMALHHRIAPKDILNRIMVSRAFSWSQMVEILQMRLETLENIDLVVVSGITSMFNEIDIKTGDDENKKFRDLKKILGGINRALEKNSFTLIMTGTRHEASQIKPLGGTMMAHFAHVIIRIVENERNIDFILDQHPFLAWKQEKVWIPLSHFASQQKKNLAKSAYKSRRLDQFF